VRDAVGAERITRHPFFSGLVLIFGAHVILAPHLTGMIFAAGWVVLTLVGAAHQSRRLMGRHGEAYEEYLKKTSAIPFVAILQRRQRIVWSELPWVHLAAGVGGAYGIRHAHASLFDYWGAPVWGTLDAITAVLIVVALYRGRSATAAKTTPRSGSGSHV
jgi:uncharacterized membrane protein